MLVDIINNIEHNTIATSNDISPQHSKIYR